MTSPAERALAHVRGSPGADEVAGSSVRRASITVSFHPDRLLADGRSVAERLVADGRYRSQFETGISNGGLTAYAGRRPGHVGAADVRRGVPGGGDRGPADLRRAEPGRATRTGRRRGSAAAI